MCGLQISLRQKKALQICNAFYILYLQKIYSAAASVSSSSSSADLVALREVLT